MKLNDEVSHRVKMRFYFYLPFCRFSFWGLDADSTIRFFWVYTWQLAIRSNQVAKWAIRGSRTYAPLVDRYQYSSPVYKVVLGVDTISEMKWRAWKREKGESTSLLATFSTLCHIYREGDTVQESNRRWISCWLLQESTVKWDVMVLFTKIDCLLTQNARTLGNLAVYRKDTMLKKHHESWYKEIFEQ